MVHIAGRQLPVAVILQVLFMASPMLWLLAEEPIIINLLPLLLATVLTIGFFILFRYLSITITYKSETLVMMIAAHTLFVAAVIFLSLPELRHAASLFFMVGALTTIYAVRPSG